MEGYHVGQVSGLVGITEDDFDPALASMFGGTSTTRSRKVINVERRITEQPAMPAPAPLKLKPQKKGDINDRGGLRKKISRTPEVISTPPIDSFLRMGKEKLAKQMKAKKKNEPVDKLNKKLKKEKSKTIKSKLVDVNEEPTEGINEDDEENQTANVASKSKNTAVSSKKPKLSTDETSDDDDSDEGNEEKVKIGDGESSGTKTLAERNAPKEKNEEQEARTIYIGNVPKELSKKRLMKIFKRFGTVETTRLRCAAPDKPSKLKKVAMNKKQLHPDRNSVTAYIRFSTREEAETAKKDATGMEILDHHLTVDLADNSTKRDNRRAIFVGNLHLKAQDDELWELFKDCGKIESVRVVRDNASGLGKGFGYVNFEDAASVELALKKEGTELRSRALRVSRCVKKLKVKNPENFVKGQNQHQPVKQEYGAAKRISMKNKFQGNAVPSGPSAAKSFSKFPNKGKQISQGRRQRKEAYSGDMTAELGKFKRNSRKPNKVELKKARFAQQLSRTVGKVNPNPKVDASFKSSVKGKKGKPKHETRKKLQKQ